MSKRIELNDAENEWIEISEEAYKRLTEGAWDKPMQEALVEYIETADVSPA